VFGASFNKDFAVMHSYVETIERLKVLQGSKYVQSKIGVSYKLAKEFLELGKQVLFTGTPCQIAGLKAFLQNPYDKFVLCRYYLPWGAIPQGMAKIRRLS
jgi:coenzyme F420-reducing hydrogenase beta subunit